MWFDERNLPLTFRIKLAEDYPNRQLSRRRQEKSSDRADERTELVCLPRRTVVFKWMELQRETRSTGRKNRERVLMAVASPTPRLSRYAFIIIRNGRRRVKSLSAPWAYQLPLNFLLFKRTLVPSSVPTLGSVPLLPRFLPLAAIRDASFEPHRRAPPT